MTMPRFTAQLSLATTGRQYLGVQLLPPIGIMPALGCAGPFTAIGAATGWGLADVKSQANALALADAFARCASETCAATVGTTAFSCLPMDLGYQVPMFTCIAEIPVNCNLVRPKFDPRPIGVVAVAWAAWEVIKWFAAIAAAPETAGGSLVGAGAIP